MANDVDSSSSIRGFSRAVSWAAFLTFDLIVLGSLVRATDSGMSCPDWPLCYDQVVPVMDTQIFVEWLHRLSALLLGGVLCYLVYKLIKFPSLRKKFGPQLYSGVALFILQCLLGGLTVLKLLNPTIVSLHLINAVLFYSILVWTAYKSRTLLSSSVPQQRVLVEGNRWLVIFFTGFAGVVFVQLLLGGMVSSNHAGLVCGDFPKCQGEWFPEGSYLFTLQMTHRIAAFTVLILGLIGNLWMRAAPAASKALKLWASSLVTLILLQGLLGMVNVFYALPTWASVMHMANGLIIYTIVLLIALTVAKFGNWRAHKKIDENLRSQSTRPLSREEVVI